MTEPRTRQLNQEGFGSSLFDIARLDTCSLPPTVLIVGAIKNGLKFMGLLWKGSGQQTVVQSSTHLAFPLKVDHSLNCNLGKPFPNNSLNETSTALLRPRLNIFQPTLNKSYGLKGYGENASVPASGLAGLIWPGPRC